MNFSDTIQHWLQGQVNAAVDGHDARLKHLEAVVTHAQYQDERTKRLEVQIRAHADRLLCIEKVYPDRATTKDLLKDTRPESLMGKLQPLIEQLIQNELKGCVKHCELEDIVTGFLGRQLQTSDDAADAKRYRWLRDQHWSDNVVAVVEHPKNTVELGTQTYSGECLDRFVDEQMEKVQS